MWVTLFVSSLIRLMLGWWLTGVLIALRWWWRPIIWGCGVGWVFVGCHIFWSFACFLVVVLIFFFFFPFCLIKRGYFLSFLRNLLNIEKANYHPTFTIFRRMFKWNKYFEDEMKPAFLVKFNKYEKKVHWLQTDKEVEGWLNQLERG